MNDCRDLGWAPGMVRALLLCLKHLPSPPSGPSLAAEPLTGLGDLRVRLPSSPVSLQLPPEEAYDVLSVADMYLLPGLKRLCGRSLAQLLDEDNVVGVWRVAKLFRLARLEDQCTEYMAKVIEKVGWWGLAGLGWDVAVVDSH